MALCFLLTAISTGQKPPSHGLILCINSRTWSICLFFRWTNVNLECKNDAYQVESYVLSLSNRFACRGKMQGSEVRRQLATSACQTGNSIDDCWRCDSSWETNRQSLADCAIGFGKNAVGGKHGSLYVVTNDSDDDVVNPSYGTLRWAAIQTEPLWIIFSQDTSIALTQELIMNSYKTIDGRGYNVQISGGAGITIQGISNIIIHGIRMFNLVPTGPAMVRDSPAHYGHRLRSDGSAISIFAGTNVWLDHLYLSDCTTNLISAIEASTFITVSNSYFTNHDKVPDRFLPPRILLLSIRLIWISKMHVILILGASFNDATDIMSRSREDINLMSTMAQVMLFGAHPEDTFDTVMQVTVAYNHFGTGLTQRMPRYLSVVLQDSSSQMATNFVQQATIKLLF